MVKKAKVLGFGFIPSESQHHFLVTIPERLEGRVFISEHFDWRPKDSQVEESLELREEDSHLRVILSINQWLAIANEVRVEFNRRLKENRLKTGQWKTGPNEVSRLFGKELVLLAWAIEEADLEQIPTAIKNWLGLAPEERWWLFTMTNAATGQAISGRGKGWRKAVQYALTENPVTIETREENREMILRPVPFMQKKRKASDQSDQRQKKLLE